MYLLSAVSSDLRKGLITPEALNSSLNKYVLIQGLNKYKTCWNEILLNIF